MSPFALLCQLPTLAAAFACCLMLPAQRPDTGRGDLSRLELEAAVLETDLEGMELEANGRILPVAPMVRTAAAGQGDAQLARRIALQELVLAVLRDELERQGAWLDDDAFAQAYDEYAEPFDRTPFTVKVIATRFKGYPSLDTFQHRWRVQESFARRLPPQELDDDALQAEAQASRHLLGNSGIEVECWFHAAAVDEHGRADFATAEQQARATLATLQQDGTAQPPVAQHLHFGEGTAILLNPLRQQLGEGEFTSFLREGVANQLFAAKAGELLGPLRGAKGCYVARVLRRDDREAAVDVKEPRLRELLVQLRRQRLFLAWVDTVFAKATLRLQGVAARAEAQK